MGTMPATPDDPDAYFTWGYSWIDGLPDGWEGMLTPTPRVERTLIAIDPDLDEWSPWDAGMMDRQVIDRIQFQLDTRNSPVSIVSNHSMYWHNNLIVGYDDLAGPSDSTVIQDSLDAMEAQGFDELVDKIEQHMEQQGGLTDRGVFYVRDSIYAGGDEELLYTYNEEYGVLEPYSARIVALPYDWVVYLANHVYTIHRIP